MVVAAYLVGGFLIASVYAAGMLRGRTDRYHRLGFVIAFTVAAIATPLQMAVGDTLARWVYNNQPVKFAAIELVPQTSSDVPETLLGHLNSNGTVTGGIPIPGLASWLSDPSTGTLDRRAGAGHRARVATGPPSPRPTSCTSPGTSWSGSGRCCFLLVGLVRRELGVPAPDAAEPVVPAGGRMRRACSPSSPWRPAGW